MYTLSAPIFTRMLTNLDAILDKAIAHAAQRKIDPAVLMASRLSPDMLPMSRQVQVACDFAKGGVARLCGEEPPKWDDTETSMADLKARIARTIEFVGTFAPARFEGGDTRIVQLQMRGETVQLTGLEYLTRMLLPNFFFHVTTAYDLLRKDGVEIGKRDFVGPA
jgi:hypothetical protein